MTAEIVPFPIACTPTWRLIAETYMARSDKAAYAKKVIDGNRNRLLRFGVAPEVIEKEIRQIERLFQRLGNHPKPLQKRRAVA